MQKIVLENDIEKAKTMINGKNSVSQKFGEIKTYSDDEIISRLSDDFDVKDIYGIGAFIHYSVMKLNLTILALTRCLIWK